MSFYSNKKLTFFDVETPNKRNHSICSIAFYAVDEDGNIENFHYLVNPEEHFDEFNIKLTGITPAMVKTAPTFDQIWNKIEPYFSNAIVVAHNANFDLNVLDKCLSNHDIDKPTFYYVCTYNLTKELMSLNSYKLNELCYHFGIDLPQHHSAECDAKACMEIFNCLENNYHLDSRIVKEFMPSNKPDKVNNSMVNKAYNSLYGIMMGIYFDDVFKENEISSLENWLEEYKEVNFDENIARVYSILQKALEDNIFEYDEYVELFDLLSQTNGEVLYSDATLSMQILLGVLKGIVSDQRINELELIKLQKWIKSHRNLKGYYPYDTLISVVDDVLLDGVIDGEEHELLIKTFNNFTNPKREDDCEIEFEGTKFCLTGNFEFGLKAEVEDKIIKAKGEVTKNVTKSVDFVVIGGAGNEAYKFGNYGTKVNKALELQEKGNPIKIISETHLIDMLFLNEIRKPTTTQKNDKISLFDEIEYEEDSNNNLKEDVTLYLKQLIYDSECEEDELEIIDLKSKVKERIISKGYSFKAYKNVWFRLNTGMKAIYRLEINNCDNLYKKISIPDSYQFEKTKDDFVRFDIIKNEEALFELFNILKELLTQSYLYICEHEPVEPYGCCSRYLECSDAKKCVNSDRKDAKGCAYRKNLLKGRIFYGKNRNID